MEEIDSHEDWVLFELEGVLTFRAPPELAESSGDAIDSQIGLWKSEHLTAILDYGLYSDRLDSYSAKANYWQASEEIDGKRALLVAFDDGPRSRSVAAHFERPSSESPKRLTAFLRGASSLFTRADLLEMARSIRFMD